VSGQKPREIAAQVLKRAHVEPTEFTQLQGLPRPSSLENVFDQALAGARLSPADRRLCQELVYGVIRWQATLDWLIARKTREITKNPTLQNLLRLGLYQIFWLDRIPDHAAVHETVELAKRLGHSSRTGFVNALLRGYLREFHATKALLEELKTSQPHLGFSHPEWLVTRWRTRWDSQRAAQLMEWNNTPPKTFARVNTLKIDAGKLLALWREENVEYDFVRRDWFEPDLVFELKNYPPLDRLQSFQKGYFYIQDPSTLLAVQLLSPRPGQSILDMCAAPGGKLTYIGQLVQNQGRILAYDPVPKRLKLVQENCLRLGVTSVSTMSSLSTGENTSLAESKFDRILIDAPCSNTGVIRRRVDLRWRLQPSELERLRGLQLSLLRQAVPALKPGGVLVYSTCSLEPEENAQVLEQFLREQNSFEIEKERLLLPFLDEVDGAYVARLKRGMG